MSMTGTGVTMSRHSTSLLRTWTMRSSAQATLWLCHGCDKSLMQLSSVHSFWLEASSLLC